MLLEGEIDDDPFEWYNRFSCDGRLISRVRVGKFFEGPFCQHRNVYLDVYKVANGFTLWNEWEFISVDASTPEQAQQIIEGFQDGWIALASLFVCDFQLAQQFDTTYDNDHHNDMKGFSD
jgi:hypothetical protein